MEEFNHLSNKLDKDIIDKGSCSDGRRFLRRLKGFCSIHCNLDKNLYTEKHYEHVRKQIIEKLKSIKNF